jgi:hypothetical protein
MLFAVGFVIELPWSPGVPHDSVVPVWTAGNRNEQTIPAGLWDPPGAESVFAGWLRFRAVQVGTQRPLAASDLAFADLDVESAATPRWRRLQRIVSARLVMARAYRQERTVAISYTPVPTLDPSSEELSEAFTAALSNLNSWLVSLGILHDDRLRRLSNADLPAVVPVLPTTADDGLVRHGPSRSLVLRPSAPHVRAYDEDELKQAKRMLHAVVTGVPLAPFYEIVQRAGSARRAARDREAVVDYATAGELFITALLGVVGRRAAMAETALANVLDGSFKDRYLHLSRLLGASEVPSDEASPMFLWWLHCYLQLNSVVHEGANATPMSSEMARIGLVDLVVNVRDLLRARDEFADIARTIHWGFRVDETGEGETSLPDPLPPG